jgi:hypothetical protein
MTGETGNRGATMADIERLSLIINMIQDGIDTVAIESYMAGEDLQDDDLHRLAESTGLSYPQLAALRDEADEEEYESEIGTYDPRADNIRIDRS